MATFLVHKPNEDSRIIRLDKELIKLGRREDNDIVLDDMFVSRSHAEVARQGNVFIIRDLKSRFGTFVNGDRVTEQPLHYGDEIQVGNILITFVDEKTLDRIPEKRGPAHRLGTTLDLVGKLETIRGLIQRGVKKEEVLEELSGLQAGLVAYQNRLNESEKAKEVASTLCEVSKIINFVFDLNVLLNLLMDLALKIIRARRGFIMLYDTADRKLKIKVARNMGLERETKTTGISQTIAWEAFQKGELLATDDAVRDERFCRQESVISYAIGSVICVPLVTREKAQLGVIYVDNPAGQACFDADDRQFMVSFAHQASIAIENAQLYEQVRAEEKIRDRLQRFFSPAVMKKIMAEEKGLTLGGEHQVATILFCDIRGYTSLTEKIDTLVAVQILNEFLSSMTEAVFEEEGTLDKYIGDCVMAIFGAPVSHSDDPLRAVRTALVMKRRVAALKTEWRKKIGIPEIEQFEIGIGIHTGEVIAGNIGNLQRMEYTVVSTAVNLASRLENYAEPGQIIISRATYDLVRDSIQVRKLPPAKLKNISQPVEIYEVSGQKEIP